MSSRTSFRIVIIDPPCPSCEYNGRLDRTAGLLASAHLAMENTAPIPFTIVTSAGGVSISVPKAQGPQKTACNSVESRRAKRGDQSARGLTHYDAALS